MLPAVEGIGFPWQGQLRLIPFGLSCPDQSFISEEVAPLGEQPLNVVRQLRCRANSTAHTG